MAQLKSLEKDIVRTAILKDKKTCLVMDVGSVPNLNYTKDYQSGALSFEIISNGKKLICNCGEYNGKNHKLIELSKSTATHSTLVLDNRSSCKMKKDADGIFKVDEELKILKKSIRQLEIECVDKDQPKKVS